MANTTVSWWGSQDSLSVFCTFKGGREKEAINRIQSALQPMQERSILKLKTNLKISDVIRSK